MQRSWWFHFRTPPRDSPSFLAAPNEALGSILFFAMQNRNSYTVVLFLGVITHSTPLKIGIACTFREVKSFVLTLPIPVKSCFGGSAHNICYTFTFS